MLQRKIVRLIDNRADSLANSREISRRINGRLLKLEKSRLQEVIKNEYTKKSVENIVKFAFWINVVTIGFVFSMIASASQSILSKDCESYAAASAHMGLFFESLKIYGILIIYPGIAVAFAAAVLIVLLVLIYFWPSRKVVSLVRSALQNALPSFSLGFPLFMGVASILLWFYIMPNMFSILREQYSARAAVQIHQAASLDCSVIEKGMKKRVSLPEW